MTKEDRENRARRILSKQGVRLIASKRRRVLYSLYRGSSVKIEINPLDGLEFFIACTDRATVRKISLDQSYKVLMQLVEASLKKPDK
jgi:hypothetical protein